MDNQWVIILIIIVIVLFIIGNLSTVHKTAKKPLRKQSLNELKETLPRSNREASNKNTQSYTKSSENNFFDQKSSD